MVEGGAPSDRPAPRVLTPFEARVLGVLVEKQATVPDTYPLSLNTLLAGVNQKTARDPVMSADEGEVLGALEGLRELSLVNEVSGTRVVRYEHNAQRGLALPSQSVALLAMLVLRGPQTAAELRLHCERLHRFADVSSVEGFLDELSTKPPARVARLVRAPGAREARWVHLLCGPVMEPATAAAAPADESLASLRAEVGVLRAQVQRILRELGLDEQDKDVP